MLDPMRDLDRDRTTRDRFAFGGVAFEILADESVIFRLSPNFARHAVRDAQPPVAADCICSVTADRASPPERVRSVQIRRVGGVIEVVSDELRAELSSVAGGHFAARARIAPAARGRVAAASASGPDAVALGLAAAILEQRGGFFLHAAAIELDGRAVLFTGPSGAGKSTAVTLAEGCPVLSFDRVVVVPVAGSFYAWSLPGGEPVERRWSQRRALPIAAVFRVRQAQGRARVRELSASARLFAVRESVSIGTTSAPVAGREDRRHAAEAQRILAVARLCEAVPVAELHTVLSAPHTELIRERVGVRSSAWPVCGAGGEAADVGA